MYLRLLALAIMIGWATWIVCYDLKHHLISNKSLLVGFLVIYPLCNFLGLKPAFDSKLAVLVGVLILITLLDLIGAGDTKLLIISLPWLDLSNWQMTALAFSLLILCQVLLIRVMERKIPTRIALAPAILLASAVNLAS
jgi:Flp pilus assembly protein protease CpaA